MTTFESLEFDQAPRPPSSERLFELLSQPGLLDNLPLPQLLQAGAKDGIALKPGRLADYSLMPIRTTPGTEPEFGYADGFYEPNGGVIVAKQFTDGRFYKIYLNRRTGVTLNYKGSPQAVVAFCVDQIGDQKGLFVGQIQGIKSRTGPVALSVGDIRGSRGLAPLNYPEVMVRTAEEVATAVGLSEVCVASARLITSNGHQYLNGNLDFNRAAQIYDSTAGALGYSETSWGYWHKSI